MYKCKNTLPTNFHTCFCRCRNCDHIIKAASSELKTYSSDDIIVHVKKFVFVLVSVNRCLDLTYPYHLTPYVPHLPPPQSTRWFSVVVWSVRADLLVVDCDCFISLLVYCSFCAFSTSFLCSFNLDLNSCPVTHMLDSPHTLIRHLVD